MTNLAQMWVDDHESSPLDDDIERLLLVRQGMSVAELSAKASKLFFDTDLTDKLFEFIDRGDFTLPAMFRSLHFPARSMWVEWPAEIAGLPGGREGVLLNYMHDGRLSAYSLVGIESKGFAACACAMTFDSDEGLFGRPNVVYTNPIYDEEDDFLYTVNAALFGIFLLSQKPTYIEREVNYNDKQQRARIKRGKPPFQEHRLITVTIGAPKIRNTSQGTAHVEGEALGKRRYHHVVGHFRTRAERIKWVAEFWRGDPRLGIVLHDRNVIVPEVV